MRSIALAGGIVFIGVYLVLVGWLAPTNHGLPFVPRSLAVVIGLIVSSVASTVLIRYAIVGTIFFREDGYVWFCYAVLFVWSGSESAIEGHLPIELQMTSLHPSYSALFMAPIFLVLMGMTLSAGKDTDSSCYRSPFILLPKWLSGYFRLSSWLGSLSLFVFAVVLLNDLDLKQYLTSSSIPMRSGIAVSAFFMCNCAAYLLNQICDRDTDAYFVGKNPFSQHSANRMPLAAILLFVLLTLLALLLGSLLSAQTAVLLLGYLGLLSIYSAPPLRVKGIALLDMIALAIAFCFLPFLIAESVFMVAFPAFVLLGFGASCLVVANQLLQGSRDFDADNAAGLRTSAILFGKRRSILVSVLLTFLGALIVSYFFWHHTKVIWLDSKLDTFVVILSFLFYLSALLPKLHLLGTGGLDLVEFERIMRQSSYAVYFTLVAYSLLIG